jgi:nitrite reductase (NO-forming)
MTSSLNHGGRPASSAPAGSPAAPADGPSRPLPAPGRPGPRRADDRRIAVVSIALAAAYLVAAGIAAAAEAAGALTATPWLAIHLALAGGASTAIAGVMPFFVAALSAGHPANARVRAAAVGFVAVGAGLVAMRGIVPTWTALPPIGGTLYLCGIGCTGLALRGAGRAGLMVRRPVVTLAYELALVNVAIGAGLGTLAVAGWLPVLERWALLRPAHAWTNLVGFVSLIIVGTLLHFLPTVLGTRIVPRATAVVAVLGIAMGSPVIVAGLAAGSSPLVRGGALLTLLGVAALLGEAGRVARSRGRWTTDPGWHRLTGLGLLAGVAWFSVGATTASLRLLLLGAAPDAWWTPAVGAPLAIGWVVQVLVASWSHLLPAIGPGGPQGHARRRAVLGRFATARLVGLNTGTAVLAAGWPAGSPPLAAAGVAAIVIAVGSSVGLVIAALRSAA